MGRSTVKEMNLLLQEGVLHSGKETGSHKSCFPLYGRKTQNIYSVTIILQKSFVVTAYDKCLNYHIYVAIRQRFVLSKMTTDN